VRKALIRRLPLALRARSALGFGRRLVAETIAQSTVRTRLRRGRGTVDIRSPIFEYLREPAAMPMRWFYAAAYTELLHRCGVDARVEIDDQAAWCRLTVVVRGPRTSDTGPDAS